MLFCYYANLLILYSANLLPYYYAYLLCSSAFFSIIRHKVHIKLFVYLYIFDFSYSFHLFVGPTLMWKVLWIRTSVRPSVLPSVRPFFWNFSKSLHFFPYKKTSIQTSFKRHSNIIHKNFWKKFHWNVIQRIFEFFLPFIHHSAFIQLSFRLATIETSFRISFKHHSQIHV